MRLPEPYVFFVDRSLGGRVVAEGLRAVGEDVRVHDDLFAQDTDDEVWLADVGQRGWVVLTKDVLIRRDSLPAFAASRNIVTPGVLVMRLGRLLAAAVILLCAVASCSASGSGGASSCASLPSCPNDPATPASDIMQCETMAADPSCGASFRQYLDCASTQVKCKSTGVIDGTATTAAIAANCGSQGAAYQRCSSTPTPCAQFDGGSCEHCGLRGEPCCAGSACGESGTQCTNGTCN